MCSLERFSNELKMHSRHTDAFDIAVPWKQIRIRLIVIFTFSFVSQSGKESEWKKLKQQPSRKATFVYFIGNAFIISVIPSKYGFEPAEFQVYTQLGPVSTVIHQTNIRFNNAPIFSLKFSSSADLRPWDKISFHKIVHKVPQIYHWIRNSAKRCNHFSCNLKCRQIFE